MQKLPLAIAFVAIATMFAAGAAVAAPKEDSPRAQVVEADCEGLGTVHVVVKGNSAAAFEIDGTRVFVSKRFAGEINGTVTTHDSQTFPVSDSFDEGARGRGFQDRLIDCTFAEMFTETFILTARDAGFFGIPAVYIGTEVTFDATLSATVSVTVVGRR